MADFVTHRNDDREGPLDDLEHRHDGDADVPGKVCGTTRFRNRYPGARPGAPAFRAPACRDTPVHGQWTPGRPGRRRPAPRGGHNSRGHYSPSDWRVWAEDAASVD